MAKKKKVDMPFRSIWPRIHVDANVRQLKDDQFRFFILSFSAPMSSDDSNFGIFEADTGALGMYCGIDTSSIEGNKKLDDIIDHFNFNKPSMLEYDRKHHILYCKNFTRYNGHYLSTWKSYIPALLSDWYATGKKVPHFWQEFFFKNEEKILLMQNAALEDQKDKVKFTLAEFIAANSKNPELAKEYRRSLKPDTQLNLFEKNNPLENEWGGVHPG